MNVVDLENNLINGQYSYLLEYYNKSLTGEIILGNELKTCLSNLIVDLEDENWIYNCQDAQIRIEFIRKNKNTRDFSHEMNCSK